MLFLGILLLVCSLAFDLWLKSKGWKELTVISVHAPSWVRPASALNGGLAIAGLLSVVFGFSL